MILGEIPIRNARRYPNKICIVEGERRYTFKEFNQRVNCLANNLLSLGIKKGDRVAVLLHNCTEYCEIYFGLAKIGAIIVPLNFRLRPKEYLSFLKISNCCALILGAEFVGEIKEIYPFLEIVNHFIIVRESKKFGETEESNNWKSYEYLINNSYIFEPTVNVSENDIAGIFFTSGTTGFPKGAMWTHRNILEQIVNLQIDLPFDRNDIGLIVLPMFHGPVTIPLLHQLFYIGGRVVIYPSIHFDPKIFFETIFKEEITCTFIVPTILRKLIDFPELFKYKDVLKKMKQVKYAGAPSSFDLLKKAIEIFGPIFVQGYGLTETIGGVSFLSKEDHILSEETYKKLKSCGKEYINTYIKIVDEEGREMPLGKVGEIIVKSDKNFIGYWGMPEETEKVLKEGWIYTGDMGMLDEEGYLYLVDRKKDLIISGGENIYPIEIEEVINNHPKVKESAVIGIPDSVWGESIKAFIVLKEGEKATPEEILEYCEKELASFKKPKYIEFIEYLPKNSMGKTIKYLLKKKL